MRPTVDDLPDHLGQVRDAIQGMPAGYPRPRSPEGLPVPWIAAAVDQLGEADTWRRTWAVVTRSCQVCGLPIEGHAVVCWRDGDETVIDGAACHPWRCWPLALSRCPALRGLHLDGQLRVAVLPVESLREPSDSDAPEALAARILDDLSSWGYAVPDR